MIFQRKIVISHDFTIILGVREKNISRTPLPPGTKNISRTTTRNSRKPSAASKTEPPNLRGTRFFFAYRVRNMQSQMCFRVALRDFRATSV